MGSGYTVEGQKTSEEKHGGLQIEVIPEFRARLRWWFPDREDLAVYDSLGSASVNKTQVLDEMNTPAELGFRVGDTLRSYPIEFERKVELTVGDLFTEDESNTWQVRNCLIMLEQY